MKALHVGNTVFDLDRVYAFQRVDNTTRVYLEGVDDYFWFGGEDGDSLWIYLTAESASPITNINGDEEEDA